MLLCSLAAEASVVWFEVCCQVPSVQPPATVNLCWCRGTLLGVHVSIYFSWNIYFVRFGIRLIIISFSVLRRSSMKQNHFNNIDVKASTSLFTTISIMIKKTKFLCGEEWFCQGLILSGILFVGQDDASQVLLLATIWILILLFGSSACVLPTIYGLGLVYGGDPFNSGLVYSSSSSVPLLSKLNGILLTVLGPAFGYPIASSAGTL